MTIGKMTSHYSLISQTLIDSTLWAIRTSLWKKYGVDEAQRIIDPLLWYINTGRAPTSFLGKLVQKKPYLIGRVLAKGGSYDEAIQRVKNYIGYREDVIK